MATRAQQIELLAAGVLYNGAVIATPYAKFLVAGTTTPKTAWDDADKAVAITKKALDAQGRAEVYGDGIYKIQIYSGDPDNGGVLLFTVDNYKVTAVAGNTRTVTSATVAGSVDDSLVEADTTSNDITYTLPDAALMAGKIIQIAKSAAANTLTIAAASGQLVNGAASVAYTAQFSTGVFQSNGSNWYVFQTVGDADTLGGFAASDFQLVADMSTSATADKGAVRSSTGWLPNVLRGALVISTATTSIATANNYYVPFTSETYDTDNIHDNVTNNTRLTVPAGVSLVRVTAQAGMILGTVTDGGTVSARIHKNGSSTGGMGRFSAIVTASTNGIIAQCLSTGVIQVTPGEYFELNLSNNSGQSLQMSSENWLSMEIIG